MAIVAEYQFGTRSAAVDDSEIRSATPEELERRRENLQRVGGAILYRKQMRELLASDESAG